MDDAQLRDQINCILRDMDQESLWYVLMQLQFYRSFHPSEMPKNILN